MSKSLLTEFGIHHRLESCEVVFLKSSYFSVLPEEPAAPDGVPGLFYPLLVHGVAGFHVFGLHVPQVDLPLKASRHQLVPHDVGTVEGQAVNPQVWSTISLFCYLFTSWIIVKKVLS